MKFNLVMLILGSVIVLGGVTNALAAQGLTKGQRERDLQRLPIDGRGDEFTDQERADDDVVRRRGPGGQAAAHPGHRY
jgi:hypothetical protein